jgi:glucokinase
MFTYLSSKFSSKDRISVERVVSGKGLANVYKFLAATHPTRIVPLVHAEFLAAGDEQGQVVSANASAGSLCHQAMSITGSAASNGFLPVGSL